MGKPLTPVVTFDDKAPNPGNEKPVEILSTSSLASIPNALSAFLDFTHVKPYDIGDTKYSNKSEEFTAKWNTSHLFENYTIITQSMVDDNKFMVVSSDLSSDRFTLKFRKDKFLLTAIASPNPTNTTETTTVMISLTQYP